MPEKTTPIKILIVDDQQIVIDGIAALVSSVPYLKIVGGIHNTTMLNETVQKHSPDVILMDLNMPDKDGIECIKELKELVPDIKILMLTGYDDIELIREALKRGARGYLLKNTGKTELLTAIKTVAKGNRYLDSNVQDKIIQSFTDEPVGRETDPENNISNLLSKRENEILKLIIEGKKSSEIATELYISINTVDTHRKNILAKCEVKNTAQLIALASKSGLIY
ncbi:MAG: response regulator [Niabella sp.]